MRRLNPHSRVGAWGQRIRGLFWLRSCKSGWYYLHMLPVSRTAREIDAWPWRKQELRCYCYTLWMHQPDFIHPRFPNQFSSQNLSQNWPFALKQKVFFPPLSGFYSLLSAMEASRAGCKEILKIPSRYIDTSLLLTAVISDIFLFFFLLPFVFCRQGTAI